VAQAPKPVFDTLRHKKYRPTPKVSRSSADNPSTLQENPCKNKDLLIFHPHRNPACRLQQQHHTHCSLCRGRPHLQRDRLCGRFLNNLHRLHHRHNYPKRSKQRQSGTVPYTVGTNGTYTIADPQGNLLGAYELPGYALLIEAAKVGPNQNTPALITAVENGPISLGNLARKNYNSIQFRTTQGGLNIGNVSVDANGHIEHDSYSPVAPIEPNNVPYFSGGSFAASSITEDPSGDFFTIDETNSTADIVFGTQNGLFAVDTGAGAILGLPKAAAKTFDPPTSGTYTALICEKANGQNARKNIESGTPTQGIGPVTVTSAGSITIMTAPPTNSPTPASDSSSFASLPLLRNKTSAYPFRATLPSSPAFNPPSPPPPPTPTRTSTAWA
jgi:hypothetical protein